MRKLEKSIWAVLCDSKMAPLLVRQRIVAHEKRGACCWHELSMHSVTGSTIIKTLNLSSSVSYYPSDEGSRKPKRSVGPCNKSFTAFSKLHFHLSHIAMHNNAHMKQDQPVQHKSLEVIDKRLRRVRDNQYVQSAISTVLHE